MPQTGKEGVLERLARRLRESAGAGFCAVAIEGERQVTAEGRTLPLPRPFMVVATENPIEFAGTYHLPEAQLDRFLMRISIGIENIEDLIEDFRQALKELE